MRPPSPNQTEVVVEVESVTCADTTALTTEVRGADSVGSLPSHELNMSSNCLANRGMINACLAVLKAERPATLGTTTTSLEMVKGS